MTELRASEILNHRLINQKITLSKFNRPDEVVSWLGAMQGQEYAMAKWAIGLRIPGSKEEAIEDAFNKGEILRTHLLRPTWHFVCPADIRWILELSAPRVHAANAYMYWKMELDDKIFKKSNDVISKALEGGNHLTREQIQSSLEKKNISADGIRLVCLMMYAELEGIICSGPRLGNQFSYALLDERVSSSKSLTKEEALTELVNRYFKSRGPATLQDFVYWSGLTMQDAKKGFENVRQNFQEMKMEGSIYILPPGPNKSRKQNLRSFLMPDYDEYGISYKNRDVLFHHGKVVKEINNRNAIFNRMLIIDGIIKASWKRTIKKNLVEIEIQPISKLTSDDMIKTQSAVKDLGIFLDKEPTIIMKGQGN